MSAVLTEDLIYEVLSAVEEIPAGKVASYGQIARLVGREKNAGWWERFSACRNITAATPVTGW